MERHNLAITTFTTATKRQPPQPMWEAGILHFHSLVAREWLPRQEIHEMRGDTSFEEG